MAPEQVVPCHTHSRWPGGILGAETASDIEAVRSTVGGAGTLAYEAKTRPRHGYATNWGPSGVFSIVLQCLP